MLISALKIGLSTDALNPDIWLKRGDYSASIGQTQGATKYYHRAFSLSDDNAFKKMAMNKASETLVSGSKSIIEQFKSISNTHNFYNFTLAEDFIPNILGDEGECKYEADYYS